MKKMTKFFALALLAGAMVSCSTEDTASTTANGKVAVSEGAAGSPPFYGEQRRKRKLLINKFSGQQRFKKVVFVQF